VVVSVAHCAGVCSAVGAHGWNINESSFLFGMAFLWLCPGVSTALLPFVGGGVWNAAGVRVWGLCLAHCWVLRQQDLFAAMQGGHFWCFFLFLRPVPRLTVSIRCVWVVVGGGLVDGVVV